MGLMRLPRREDTGLLLGEAGGWGEGRLPCWTENPSLSRTEWLWSFCEAHSLSAH